MPKRPTKTERRVYLKHIARLEERNRVLAEMLVEERKMRRAAYGWYRGRLRSRIDTFFSAMLYVLNDGRR